MNQERQDYALSLIRSLGLLELEFCVLPSEGSQKAQVLELLLDRRWHTNVEIVAYAGSQSALRRLRELRKIPGLDIVCARLKATNDAWAYQLSVTG